MTDRRRRAKDEPVTNGDDSRPRTTGSSRRLAGRSWYPHEAVAAAGTLVAVLLIYLIYGGSLSGPFVFDDVRHILDNPHVRLVDLTFDGIERAAFESVDPNRFVANVSFALNYYFHRYEVAGYRAVNILIHLVTGLLLYHLARTTLSLPALRSLYPRSREISFLTALVWLVHPIAVQSVTYVVQRMNSMATMFYVLSLLLYARGRLAADGKRKWAFLAGCPVAGLLALGSKEIAATLPIFLFIYEWYFFRDLSRAWLKRRVGLIAGAAVLAIIVGVLFLGADPIDRILSGYDARGFTLTERLLTQSRVVIYYLGLLAVPHPSRLSLEHCFSLSHSPIDPPTTLLSMAAIAGLVWLAFRTARNHRLVSFCIVWFLGHLLIESSVLALEILFEHRTYLPSMGVFLLVVASAYRYAPRRWLPVAGLCAVVIVFTAWSRERSNVWSDPTVLFRDVVEKCPTSARGHGNLGKALVETGHVSEGIDHYEQAIRIRPGYSKVHVNLANALARQGRFDEAYEHYREGLRLDGDSADGHYNVGVTLAQHGRLDEAIRHYRLALQADPDHAEAHNNMGSALARQGKVDEALDYFATAIRVKPGYAKAHANLAGALLVKERYAEAWAEVEKSRRHGFEPPAQVIRALTAKMPQPERP